MLRCVCADSVWTIASGRGVAGSLLPLPPPLHVVQPVGVVRDATVRIFSNAIDDSVTLLQPCVELCSAFATACGIATVVGRAEVLQALMSADKSVSLNFGIPAAVLSADQFVFPSEVWKRDGMSLLRHNMSLESLLYEFHEQRRDSYLSPESVQRSLGTISHAHHHRYSVAAIWRCHQRWISCSTSNGCWVQC